MEVRIISEQEVRDIVLSILSEEMNSELWSEDGSIRMDIKVLKVKMHTRENTNSGAIESLFERVRTIESNVKKLEKNEVMDANAIDTIFDRLTVLENEMIDKDLRISKLEQEVIEKLWTYIKWPM